MNRCPITYEETKCRYSDKGVKHFSRNLESLNDLNFSKEELLYEVRKRVPQMSIQGVQPKLSAVLNVSNTGFELVSKKGRYILKPPHSYFKDVPQNEDLTMRLAGLLGFKTPKHGLIFGNDNSLTYIVKRFDRARYGRKIAVEDFAQLSKATRNTKYKSSMEKVAEVINEFCTFPLVEKAKLFELTLFNFLIGNEDMHLKNFTLIRNDDVIELSPFYDLLNTRIILEKPKEEIALPINGKKNNLTKGDLVDYFGREVCSINEIVIKKSLEKFRVLFERWNELIEISFLSNDMKDKYSSLLNNRKKRLFN